MENPNKFSLKLLSVVIPAYKQEKTITKDIKKITNALDSLGYNYEIIVVIDGFVDKTFDKVKKIKTPKIKILSYKQNQGKGYVIDKILLLYLST